MARVHVYRVLDRDYPGALRALSSPPDPLWVRGELLAAPSVAIVGTREPSRAAESYAHALAFRLAGQGVTVWSGGAVGIDAAAHRGALDAGGMSVAVVGTGLDHCYPQEHAALYEEIVLTGGAIVSPFERSQHASLITFPQRNAVLAALTLVTVLVQAPYKSGARSTARHARRLERPLFVVPAPPWDERSAGNLEELRVGARLLSDERHLFDFMGVPRSPAIPIAEEMAATVALSSEIPPSPRLASLEGPTRRGPVRRRAKSSTSLSLLPDRAPDLNAATLEFEPTSLSEEARAVWEATSSSPLHLDELCVRTGFSPALIQGALLTLSLQAVLVEGPPGWFRRLNAGKYSA